MFIAFMGMPGCGKSSTAKILAQKLGCPVYLEPEEDEWAELVRDRQTYGAFSALSWFRNTRIIGYLKAYGIHCCGGTAVVDSLYDKLIYGYIDDPSMTWLIDRHDPYFRAAKAVAAADFFSLPDPTHVVFVYVDPATWTVMLENRGREFDANNGVGGNLGMQAAMERACKNYCADRGIHLSLLGQRLSSAEDSAADLEKLIRGLGVQ